MKLTLRSEMDKLNKLTPEPAQSHQLDSSGQPVKSKEEASMTIELSELSRRFLWAKTEVGYPEKTWHCSNY